MGDISKNFNRKEFACKCKCGLDTVDVELISILQDVREHFDKPVRISSGCRCKKHNEKVGGEEASKHLTGRAADIVVSETRPIDVYNYLSRRYPSQYGFISYSGWVHVDSRDYKFRQVK